MTCLNSRHTQRMLVQSWRRSGSSVSYWFRTVALISWGRLGMCGFCEVMVRNLSVDLKRSKE